MLLQFETTNLRAGYLVENRSFFLFRLRGPRQFVEIVRPLLFIIQLYRSLRIAIVRKFFIILSTFFSDNHRRHASCFPFIICDFNANSKKTIFLLAVTSEKYFCKHSLTKCIPITTSSNNKQVYTLSHSPFDHFDFRLYSQRPDSTFSPLRRLSCTRYYTRPAALVFAACCTADRT